MQVFFDNGEFYTFGDENSVYRTFNECAIFKSPKSDFVSSVDKNGRRGYAVFDNSVVYSDNYRNAMINPGSITATGLEFAYDDLGDVVYRYQKGETKAIYEIGMAYLEGRGLLKQDKRKAEEYMKKAADKGDSDALAFFENQKKEAEAAEKAKKKKKPKTIKSIGTAKGEEGRICQETARKMESNPFVQRCLQSYGKRSRHDHHFQG